MKPILAFDVNETLLDLKALDSLFIKMFDDSTVRELWFSQFIQNAFVSIITDSYKPFGEIGISALDMIAEKKKIKLNQADKLNLADKIKNLPAHPDVISGLALLKKAGFRMVTLTNSTLEVGKAQIKNAGIEEYLEEVISADEIKKLKPAKESYLYASKKLKINPKNMILIASHAWDIAGALNAGCNAAFISRSSAVLDPLVPQPSVIGKDLKEVAAKIIDLYK